MATTGEMTYREHFGKLRFHEVLPGDKVAPKPDEFVATPYSGSRCRLAGDWCAGGICRRQVDSMDGENPRPEAA
jgi:hypothetical protein